MAGTLPRTPIAVLATTEESLHSSMTEATVTEGGKNMRHIDRLNNCCHMSSFFIRLFYSSVTVLKQLQAKKFIHMLNMKAQS